jgi:uncharacterized membrane protein YeaQ/YmgE (transglycosylase-associated protein family)
VNIALWIFAGAIVGWVAYAVAGYNEERGLIVSIIVGAFGGAVGGMALAPMLMTAAATPPGVNTPALVIAVAVAATLLVLCNVVHKRWGI